MKILWIGGTLNAFLKARMEEATGEECTFTVQGDITSAQTIQRDYRQGKYDFIVFIGPLGCLQELVKRQLPVVVPTHHKTEDVPDYYIYAQGYKFCRYNLVTSVEVRCHELRPEHAKDKNDSRVSKTRAREAYAVRKGPRP